MSSGDIAQDVNVKLPFVLCGVGGHVWGVDEVASYVVDGEGFGETYDIPLLAEFFCVYYTACI